MRNVTGGAMPGPARHLIGALFGLLCVAPAGPAAAQAVLRGQVLADATGQPLVGAEVMIQSLGRSARTGEGGRFELADLPQGRQRVLVRQIGYEPRELSLKLASGDTTEVTVRLPARAVRLDSVSVTAPGGPPVAPGIRDMEARRRLGFGKFITTEELRRLENRDFATVLRERGVKIYRDARGRLSPINDRGPVSLNPSRMLCVMQVVLDGVPVIQADSVAQDIRSGPPPFDLSTVAVSSLDGVEIYTSIAGAPLQYERANASCGVLILWTRSH